MWDGRAKKRRGRCRGGDRPGHPPPSFYTLSAAQREENAYPTDHDLAGDNDRRGRWISTRNLVPGHEARSMVAVDCEMVATELGSELARLSAVDSRGVLLDVLVQPKSRVLNYRTQYSGITEKTLAPVRTTLEEAREQLLSFLGPRTILIGHSLENDLWALCMQHEHVIDTAVIYPRACPPQPSCKHGLAYLVQRLLGRQVQAGAHDSVEDARAALDLVRLKMKHGPQFGYPYAPRLSRTSKRARISDERANTGAREPQPSGHDKQTRPLCSPRQR